MKQQNDWYTGINHYDNYVEKEIGIERRIIDGPPIRISTSVWRYSMCCPERAPYR